MKKQLTQEDVRKFVNEELDMPVRTYTLPNGKKFCAHPGCASSFKEDRAHGLIYPALYDPETKRTLNAEEMSMQQQRCVYCDLYASTEDMNRYYQSMQKESVTYPSTSEVYDLDSSDVFITPVEKKPITRDTKENDKLGGKFKYGDDTEFQADRKMRGVKTKKLTKGGASNLGGMKVVKEDRTIGSYTEAQVREMIGWIGHYHFVKVYEDGTLIVPFNIIGIHPTDKEYPIEVRTKEQGRGRPMETHNYPYLAIKEFMDKNYLRPRKDKFDYLDREAYFDRYGLKEASHFPKTVKEGFEDDHAVALELYNYITNDVAYTPRITKALEQLARAQEPMSKRFHTVATGTKRSYNLGSRQIEGEMAALVRHAAENYVVAYGSGRASAGEVRAMFPSNVQAEVVQMLLHNSNASLTEDYGKAKQKVVKEETEFEKHNPEFALDALISGLPAADEAFGVWFKKFVDYQYTHGTSQFAKLLRGKSGNKKRDMLWAFAEHWLTAYELNPEEFESGGKFDPEKYQTNLSESKYGDTMRHHGMHATKHDALELDATSPRGMAKVEQTRNGWCVVGTVSGFEYASKLHSAAEAETVAHRINATIASERSTDIEDSAYEDADMNVADVSLDEIFNPEKKVVSEGLSVPDQHQLKILLGNLRLSAVGAHILGGDIPESIRLLIQKFHYSPQQVKQLLSKYGHSTAEIEGYFKEALGEAVVASNVGQYAILNEHWTAIRQFACSKRGEESAQRYADKLKARHKLTDKDIKVDAGVYNGEKFCEVIVSEKAYRKIKEVLEEAIVLKDKHLLREYKEATWNLDGKEVMVQYRDDGSVGHIYVRKANGAPEIRDSISNPIEIAWKESGNRQFLYVPQDQIPIVLAYLEANGIDSWVEKLHTPVKGDGRLPYEVVKNYLVDNGLDLYDELDNCDAEHIVNMATQIARDAANKKRDPAIKNMVVRILSESVKKNLNEEIVTAVITCDGCGSDYNVSDYDSRFAGCSSGPFCNSCMATHRQSCNECTASLRETLIAEEYSTEGLDSDKLEQFIAVYSKELEQEFAKHPEYGTPAMIHGNTGNTVIPATTPDALARKMTLAIYKGSGNNSSNAFKRACKKFGIPPTYSGFRAAFKALAPMNESVAPLKENTTVITGSTVDEVEVPDDIAVSWLRKNYIFRCNNPECVDSNDTDAMEHYHVNTDVISTLEIEKMANKSRLTEAVDRTSASHLTPSERMFLEAVKLSPDKIAEIEGHGDVLDEYPVDESSEDPNAGDAVEYSYEGKKYIITTWNTMAVRHRDGQKTVTVDTLDESVEHMTESETAPSASWNRTWLAIGKKFYAHTKEPIENAIAGMKWEAPAGQSVGMMQGEAIKTLAREFKKVPAQFAISRVHIPEVEEEGNEFGFYGVEFVFPKSGITQRLYVVDTGVELTPVCYDETRTESSPVVKESAAKGSTPALELCLQHDQNPDYMEGQGSGSGYMHSDIPEGMGVQQWVPCTNLKDARAKFLAWIQENELGGGNLEPCAGNVRDAKTKKPVARISYNGRVWEPHDPRGSGWKNAKELHVEVAIKSAAHKMKRMLTEQGFLDEVSHLPNMSADMAIVPRNISSIQKTADESKELDEHMGAYEGEGANGVFTRFASFFASRPADERWTCTWENWDGVTHSAGEWERIVAEPGMFDDPELNDEGSIELYLDVSGTNLINGTTHTGMTIFTKAPTQPMGEATKTEPKKAKDETDDVLTEWIEKAAPHYLTKK